VCETLPICLPDCSAHTQESIAAYRKGTLTLQAGCNMEQTLEATVTGELNGIREAAGKVWHSACVTAQRLCLDGRGLSAPSNNL
jgi:hypothetical protein